VTLVRLDDEDHQLLVTMHHIIADGWSLNVLIDEFSRLYAAATQGAAATLAPLPTQYADYGSWQRQWLAQGEGERQLAYWKAQLGDEHPTLELATDHPRSAIACSQRRASHRALGASLSDAIRKTAQAHQSTPFMLLLSAFQSLLHRYSGQRDIRIGVPNANRPRLETQGLIGFFINTQVLRAEIDSRLPFVELLAQTRQAALGAQANQDLPFEQLLEAFPQAREQGLFQVMFNHQQRDSERTQAPAGIARRRAAVAQPRSQVRFATAQRRRSQRSADLSFDYASELFDATTIERLAEHFSNLLREVCERPQASHRRSAIADRHEHDQQKDWGVAPCTPAQQWLPELLNEQARLTPERTALVWDGGSLDFAELHTQANRLAHYLRDKGVGPDVCVAIAAERSPQLLIGLLAIIKAGGAYVPLDPDYPADRLAYMLSDSGVQLLLTQTELLERCRPATASA
jgi:non-ribosomal peptide synthetase component F